MCFLIQFFLLYDTHLPVAHKSCVFSHKYVGSKKEDEGMTEAQHSPVQERPERQQGVLADISVNDSKHNTSPDVELH